MARLQKAAEAFKQLNQRKKGKKKGKKGPAGAGLGDRGGTAGSWDQGTGTQEELAHAGLWGVEVGVGVTEWPLS